MKSVWDNVSAALRPFTWKLVRRFAPSPNPLPHHVLRSADNALGDSTPQHVTGERGHFMPDIFIRPPYPTFHQPPHSVTTPLAGRGPGPSRARVCGGWPRSGERPR